MLAKLFVCGFILVHFSNYSDSVSFYIEPAKVGQFPSTGGFLRVSDNQFVGGATIIHPQYVMGVNFNLDNSSYKLIVFAGDIDHYTNSTTPSRQERAVTHYFKQNFGRYRSLLIFRLESPFEITKEIRILPMNRKVLKANRAVKIAGWGLPSDLLKDDDVHYTQFLNFATATVSDRKSCIFNWTGQGAWREFFCIAGGPSLGKLDHGGPVYLDNRICGIASPLIEQWNLKDSRRVAVVTDLHDWIQNVVDWNGARYRYDAIPIYENNRYLRGTSRNGAKNLLDFIEVYNQLLFAWVLKFKIHMELWQ